MRKAVTEYFIAAYSTITAVHTPIQALPKSTPKINE